MKLNFNILMRIIPKFMIIKFTENSKIVIVKDLFNEYSDIKYDRYSVALDLCRLRLNKVLGNKLSEITIPFSNISIVF